MLSAGRKCSIWNQSPTLVINSKPLAWTGYDLEGPHGDCKQCRDSRTDRVYGWYFTPQWTELQQVVNSVSASKKCKYQMENIVQEIISRPWSVCGKDTSNCCGKENKANPKCIVSLKKNTWGSDEPYSAGLISIERQILTFNGTDCSKLCPGCCIG